MKKGKSNSGDYWKNYLLALGFLVIISALFLHFIGPLIGLSLSSGGTGVTVIGSCSEPGFTNGSYPFSCTVTPSGNSQVLLLGFTPNSSASVFGTGIQTNANVTLQELNNDLRFTFSPLAYPVYQYTAYSGIRYSDTSGWGCQPGVSSGSTIFVGNTPYVGGTPAVAGTGCMNVFQTQIGSIYLLDPSNTPEFNVQINMTTTNGTYSGILNLSNTAITTPGFQANFVGSLSTGISYTAPYVAAYVSNNPSNPLEIVNSVNANSVITQGMSINNAASYEASGSAYASSVATMLSSTPEFSQYCQNSTVASNSYVTASVECIPNPPPFTQAINIRLGEAAVGIQVPNGMPQIQSVNASPLSGAATLSEVSVYTTNVGSSTDTFEGSIQCPQDLAPYSSQLQIPAGQTLPIEIPYSGSNFVGLCNVTVTSVSNPSNTASSSVRVSLAPFCTSLPPNSLAQAVSTDRGCQYICPLYAAGTDVYDPSCQAITNYNGSGQSFLGNHCIGIGQYVSTDVYLYDVDSGLIQPYIPPQIPNEYFITTNTAGTPVCTYVNEFGYSNGSALTSYIFNPALGIPPATMSAPSTASPANASPSSGSSTSTPNSTSTLPVTQPTSTGSSGSSQFPITDLIYIVAAGIIILAGYWIFIRKK